MLPPPTLIEIAIQPRDVRDQAALLDALAEVTGDDDLARFAVDTLVGQIILGGQSEEHVDAILTRLRETLDVELRLGAPQIGYRETIERRVEVDYTHNVRDGAGSEFARVKLVLDPRPGDGIAFDSKVLGGAIPQSYLAGVTAGVAEALRSGLLHGYALIDVAVSLLDGAYHEADSSAATFEIATLAACRQGMLEAGLVLLGPMMRVEVAAPDDRADAVCDDLARRRGRILDRHGAVRARVPLANLLGYGTSLRSLAGPDAHCTMVFDGYARIEPPAPPDGSGAAALRFA